MKNHKGKIFWCAYLMYLVLFSIAVEYLPNTIWYKIASVSFAALIVLLMLFSLGVLVFVIARGGGCSTCGGELVKRVGAAPGGGFADGYECRRHS